ncbi:class I SAM-dependent methyltransferase [Acidisphaera sp. L21]|uniref:class I SAM-dependent methyltransferase n=1 Tax=Acidisphaera sp. L21 TaxID=1641851 RepID=UPI00131A952A|nr:class I SAM-dependent methyltransferase [Acidisphaera sp. L21]
MAKALDALTRAAIRHGSDRYGGHLYTPIYHALFQHMREQPLRFLEIGVGGYSSEKAGGLGLKMWAEYFPNASIHGLDVERKTLSLSPRVKVHQGSQVDYDLLDRLSREAGPFDIIIDDGSHAVDHMVGSFRHLYPAMAPNGIYAIEDTQTSFASHMGGHPDGRGTVFDLAHRLSLAMHAPEGFVDPNPDPLLSQLATMTSSVATYRNVTVFQRGPNTYPSNQTLDFGNAEVQDVFDSITAQNDRDPSSGGTLSRIDMLIWAGKTAEAGAMAIETANRYPREMPVLFELLRMMEWANQSNARAHIAVHIANIR